MREWHLIIDLGNHHPGFRHGSLSKVVDQSIAVIPVRVGRAHLHKSHIAADQPLLDHGRHLADVAGNDLEPLYLAQGAQGAHRSHAGQPDAIRCRDREHAGKTGSRKG